MKTSPKMHHVVTQLATTHAVDLTQRDTHLSLQLPGYERLTIEIIGQHQVSVAHYFEQNGDLVADPDVIFFTGYGQWVPIEITYSFGLYFRYATLNEIETAIVKLDIPKQADLAVFTEQWAQNLIDQGWLSHAQR